MAFTKNISWITRVEFWFHQLRNILSALTSGWSSVAIWGVACFNSKSTLLSLTSGAVTANGSCTHLVMRKQRGSVLTAGVEYQLYEMSTDSLSRARDMPPCEVPEGWLSGTELTAKIMKCLYSFATFSLKVYTGVWLSISSLLERDASFLKANHACLWLIGNTNPTLPTLSSYMLSRPFWYLINDMRLSSMKGPRL